ncbi:restriction endonuclease subunit S [Tidjanibacter massiliensis]|uniref:restriction endonuclease subunit S n=1 Tax=Tidjanibacter massiliensis TaxID=1871003 RepID=UPI00115FAA04|nr:restriction endonuclease subunit S [Tidjanibacter massiliensis]
MYSKGDELLFPASTTVDAVSLITPTALIVANVVLGGDMFGIHINKEYNAIYISYILNYVYRHRIAKYAQGSTIIHLHYKDIKNFKLLLPPIEKQEKV